jgi:UDP-N-acetylenolpyruvoylglucosamine reductase
MLITALRRANFPAGYVLGGLFADGATPAAAGANEWVVAEIDESDGTIERFSPEVTVAVNLDWDHPDFYRQPADLEAAFAALFARTRGAVLLSSACAMSARMGAPRAVTFGAGGDFAADLCEDDGSHLGLKLAGKFSIARARVRAAGRFNAANATAALAAAQLIGATLTPGLLEEFPGVRRRQTLLSSAGDIAIVEDYAHHPAEIRALLESLRGRVASGGRLIVAFQPHRFSRTAQFKAEFARAGARGPRPAAGCLCRGRSPAGRRHRRRSPSRSAGHGPEISGDHVPPQRRHRYHFHAVHRSAPRRRGRVCGRRRHRSQGPGVARPMGQPAMNPADWDELAVQWKGVLSPATKLTREEPLASRTTLRVGGAARLLVEPANLADLQAVLRLAQTNGVAVFVLGRGSNLIVPDRGVDGLVLSLAHEAWAGFESRPDRRVWAGAGLRLKNLCGLAAKAGLVGFEFLEGIPGSVGGALRMNAGAMGGWMFDVVDEVQLISLAGAVATLAKSAMHVDYRHCAELEHAIALGALLRPAAEADLAAVKRQMDAYARKRHESQPREPSAGCIFKNPPGTSAGRLIDESGLKGQRVGDAEVSPVHANFIVNRGAARGADVLELIRRVRARVREVKGVDLQPEVLLYGQRWEDVL